MMAVLVPHSTASTVVDQIQVELARDGVLLWLRFSVEGGVDRVRWPAAEPQGRGEDLWKHTCFEVFVGTADGYREYNLSPSGQWATYAFDGYRSGMRKADKAATVLGLDGGADYVALEARIELPVDAVGPLGLSAVIEDLEGRITYWALAHPSDKPDFHHPDSFILELPPVEPA